MTKDADLIKETVYYICAKEFGWTIKQTDEIDQLILEDLMVIVSEVKKKEAQSMKK